MIEKRKKWLLIHNLFNLINKINKNEFRIFVEINSQIKLYI